MKIAFLFAGQYRPIPKDLISYSLQNLTKGLDYNIFCYSWDEPGESLDHREEIPKLRSDNSSYAEISSIFSEFNLKEIRTESYNDFVVNLPKNQKKILNSKKYHKGTIFALPQIYTLSKCYKLLGNYQDDFDLIFRCRFDSIYLHPLKIYPLRSFLNSSSLYNINFGRAYYPNRIYDIFFGGSKKSMSFLDHIWEDIPQLVENNLNNGQDKRDACRLFFVAAVTNNVKVKSLKTRICDIYRPFKDNYYEQYLISSHLLSLKFDIASFKSIPYFIRWFFYRRINFMKFSLIIGKTIFLIPLSYLKRIKYFLKIYKYNKQFLIK